MKRKSFSDYKQAKVMPERHDERGDGAKCVICDGPKEPMQTLATYVFGGTEDNLTVAKVIDYRAGKRESMREITIFDEDGKTIPSLGFIRANLQTRKYTNGRPIVDGDMFYIYTMFDTKEDGITAANPEHLKVCHSALGYIKGASLGTGVVPADQQKALANYDAYFKGKRATLAQSDAAIAEAIALEDKINNPTSALSAKDKERVARGERWFGRSPDTAKGEPVFFNVVTDEHFVLTEAIQERLGVIDIDDKTAAVCQLIDRQDPATKNNFTMMSSEAIVRMARLTELTVAGALEYFMLRLVSRRAGITAGIGSPEWKRATAAWERFLAAGGSEAAAIGAAKAAVEHFKAAFPQNHRWDITEPALSPKERAKAERKVRARFKKEQADREWEAEVQQRVDSGMTYDQAAKAYNRVIDLWNEVVKLPEGERNAFLVQHVDEMDVSDDFKAEVAHLESSGMSRTAAGLAACNRRDAARIAGQPTEWKTDAAAVGK